MNKPQLLPSVQLAEASEAEFHFRCKKCSRTWRALWPMPIVLGSLGKRIANESCPDCAQREIYLVCYEEDATNG